MPVSSVLPAALERENRPSVASRWNTMPTVASTKYQVRWTCCSNGHQPSHGAASATRGTDSGAHPTVDSGNISTKNLACIRQTYSRAASSSICEHEIVQVLYRSTQHGDQTPP